MMVQKNTTWKSMVTCCFKNQEATQQSSKTKKNIRKQSSSFQRVSLSDISNQSSNYLSEDLSISLASSNIHAFTLQELKVITQSFSSNNFLGEGGFGPVHKGFIHDRLRPGLKAQPVAVKLLDLEGSQGHREWLTEVIFLGQLRHAHLVKLIGYCCEEEHRLIVYEYMPRGSLENQLFRRYSVTLPWSVRMKIALGAAKGVQFLHELENPVIFRDFKASNILLDSDYTPKLSDFGLATDGPEGFETHVSTRVLGTHGYAAPEYIKTGHLTSMSDVYSFGVVLLELLTGRRAVDKTRTPREQNLMDWARPLLNDNRKLARIIDPRLEGQYSEIGSSRAAALAYRCLSHRPKHRPTMSAVVKILDSLKDYVDTPIEPFVYIVPNENGINSTNINSDTKVETNGTKRVKKHHHKHQLHQSNGSLPKSPRGNNSETSSEQNHQRNVEVGTQNSSILHNRITVA